MMHIHLSQTAQEATARLLMQWDTDVGTYDAVQTHILHMADALSTAINMQFPQGPVPAM
jgi:hypothetical protein